mgnify:CR=1 FL=1|jgi:hypothetical protein
MRLRELEIGQKVIVRNVGDFAMTHKKWINEVGVVNKQCVSGKIEVQMTKKYSIVCPLRVLEVFVSDEIL